MSGAEHAASSAAAAAAGDVGVGSPSAPRPPRLVTLSSSGPLGVKSMAVPSAALRTRFGCSIVVEALAERGALRRLGTRPPFGLAFMNGTDLRDLHQGDVVGVAKDAVKAGPWTLVVAFAHDLDAGESEATSSSSEDYGSGGVDALFPPSPLPLPPPSSPPPPPPPWAFSRCCAS
jgi:hypothetical protein